LIEIDRSAYFCRGPASSPRRRIVILSSESVRGDRLSPSAPTSSQQVVLTSRQDQWSADPLPNDLAPIGRRPAYPSKRSPALQGFLQLSPLTSSELERRLSQERFARRVHHIRLQYKQGTYRTRTARFSTDSPAASLLLGKCMCGQDPVVRSRATSSSFLLQSDSNLSNFKLPMLNSDDAQTA